MKQVNLRLPDELLEQIDARCGASRNHWILAAIEAALGVKHRRQPGPDVTNIVSSAQAKRGVGPVPKPGKR